jgi:hypothetical protein
VATIKRVNELVSYRFETDSMGRVTSDEDLFVSSLGRHNDGVVFAEVQYEDNREKPSGFYYVDLAIRADLSRSQKQELLRKVTAFLHKNKMITKDSLESLLDDLKRL